LYVKKKKALLDRRDGGKHADWPDRRVFAELVLQKKHVHGGEKKEKKRGRKEKVKRRARGGKWGKTNPEAGKKKRVK